MIARGSPAEIIQPLLLKRIFGVEMDVLALRETGQLLTYPR
ncbi:hypothetical protein Q0601_22445 [Paracoccus onubensis]|nr:hypothetical protein [Paracoccus onubensis]MDP0929949.1 hypothetical protein [Paracoccus onubensis]